MDVLIVDDDINICNLLESYCEDLNLFQNIVISSNGADASSKVKSQVFSLVILDLHLPKKNGITILNELNADPNKARLTPIKKFLVISGGLDKNLHAHVMQTGVEHVLSKPFSESDFKKKVTEICTTN